MKRIHSTLGTTLSLTILLSVTRTINTGMDVSRSIAFLDDNTAVISGHEADGSNKLTRYDLQNGAVVGYYNLPPDAHGLAEVKLGENLALVVSHRFVTCFWLSVHFSMHISAILYPFSNRIESKCEMSIFI